MVALMGKRLIRNLPGSQQGMALITGLLLLMVLTLLGITAMDNAVMEETMVKNQRDKQVAFQAAESAMVDGFGWLDTQIIRPRPGSLEPLNNGAPRVVVNAPNTLTNANAINPTWWVNNGLSYGVATNAAGIAGVAVQPRHITEEFVPAEARSVRDDLVVSRDYATSPGRQFYRISSQGSGFSASTQVVVQGIYVKRY